MTEIEVALLVAIITSIIGPIIVTKYRVYKEKNPPKKSYIDHTLETNHLIEEQLDEIKSNLKSNRVWVSQFHNGGNFYPTGKSIAKFSITFEVNDLNVVPLSETISNIPVSLFNRSFSILNTKNEILIEDYKNLKETTWGLRYFASNLGTKSSYLFSLRSVKGDFIGVLGVEWEKSQKSLNQEEISYLRSKSISLGTLIGTYLYSNQQHF